MDLSGCMNLTWARIRRVCEALDRTPVSDGRIEQTYSKEIVHLLSEHGAEKE